jgi:dGTPase
LAKHFGFDETLAEAIALAHDVGHTPFGHVGERTLNLITNNCDTFQDFTIHSDDEKGFKHNWQGLKVVSSLEKISTEYKGLNLTDYTLWGILNHSNLNYKKCTYYNNNNCHFKQNHTKCNRVVSQPFILNYYKRFEHLLSNSSWTCEGLIVSHADEIAQRYHDIEDALLAKIIEKEELIRKIEESFSNVLTEEDHSCLDKIINENNLNVVLHDFSGFIIRLYSKNLIDNSQVTLIDQLINKFLIKDVHEFNNIKPELQQDQIIGLICFSESFIKCDEEFHKFLFERILNSHLAQAMDGKSSYILRKIIHAYLDNPKQLPDSTITTLFSNYLDNGMFKSEIFGKSDKEQSGHFRSEINKQLSSTDRNKFNTTLIRTIVDFIAGMTDSFAISQFNLLYKGESLKNY